MAPRGPAAWEQRFRSPRHTLPAWAKQDPDRCVFVADVTGTSEVYAWDRRRPDGRPRQVTDRPAGTLHCAIESSGQWVWWFADTGGDEFGVWRRQPFTGGPESPVSADLAPAWQAGLAIGWAGHALIGRSTEEEGTTIHLVAGDGSARTIYQHPEPGYAADLSRDLTLAAIEHSESGDARNLGVRVLTRAGDTVLDLARPGHGYSVVGFSPLPADPRLLVLHELAGRWEPMLVDPRSGRQVPITLDLPGDLDVAWFPDGRHLLVHHDQRGRSELYRYDLASAALTPLDIPPGTVEYIRTRPDGVVWYLWSSAATGPRFCSTEGDPGLRLSGPPCPESVGVRDVWVDGPGGPVHALVSTPVTGPAPYPAVFLVHGGPEEHDKDEFDPETAAWVDHGFAVVQVNYRGSTGYGKPWRDALRERVGLIELEDIGAVRRWAVRSGLVDPARLVLAGSSWGGYLALLGLGTQPEDWAVGVADAPIADYPAAYADAMEDIRAMDRALFGGSPAEVPDRYRRSSPLTYVDAVRAPVLISAGNSDPRCPMRQVDNYVDRLRALGREHAIFRHPAGHESAVVDERVQTFRRALAFVRQHLPRPPHSAARRGTLLSPSA